MKRFLLIFILGLLPSLSILARETVKGTVVDAQGNPIPGVRVEIPGNSQYVFTDLDGAFQIILREPTKNLKFTYPGYSPSTYKVKPEMTIVLGKGWSGHEKGYRGMYDLEGGIGFKGKATFASGDIAIKDIQTLVLPGWTLTQGYQFNRNLFVGIGFGAYLDIAKCHETEGDYQYTSIPLAGAEIPIFLTARWDFGLTQKTAPYVDVRVGYIRYFDRDHDEDYPTFSAYSWNSAGSSYLGVWQKDCGSFFIAPSVGYRVNIHKKFGMNFGLRLIMGRKKKYSASTSFYQDGNESSNSFEFKHSASNVLLFNIGFDF